MERVKHAHVDRVAEYVSDYPDVIEVLDSDIEPDVPPRPPSRAESFYEGDESLILAFNESDLISSTTTTSESSTDSSSSSPNTSSSNILTSAKTTNILGKRAREDSSILIGNTAKIQKINTALDPNEPYVIAQNTEVERLLHARSIGHGLQYELARLISTGTPYEKITDGKLQKLRAHKNLSSLAIDMLVLEGEEKLDKDHNKYAKFFSAEYEATSPWAELQKEESALAHDPDAGVGNNPDLLGWYGGQIVFRGRLVEAQYGHYRIELEPAVLGPSSRFTRQFGSWSFLRIKIPDKILHAENNKLDTFFKKRFVLWNKVFRSIYAKEGTVFLFWTNERSGPGMKIPGRMSFEDFLNKCNPISENANQLMTKWSARIALGFSNSVPGPVIAQENIQKIHDEMSPDGQSDMTDGCGFSSIDIHIKLAQQFQLGKQPTAFQFRLGGSKGLLVFKDDRKHDNASSVALRPSQIKINFPEFWKLVQAWRTIDLLRISHLRIATRLSTEVIINLHENGVPADFFVKLMKQSVRNVVEGLTKWDGPDDMVNLCLNVFRAENIHSARRAREARGEARTRGFSNRSLDDQGEDENEDDIDLQAFTEKSTAWWGDGVSGCPASLGETVVALIFAGFTPQECPVLREKLKNILDVCVERETTRMRFEVLQSCSAFAIPDPLGVLEENQIHVRSSKPEFTLDGGMMSDTLVGDVLITRNPCKVPSDTRKVQAVAHPLLHQYTDVIVFSTKGNRRLIDYLAGGDYDGDTVIVFWDKEMVDGFKNADDKYSHEPPIVEACFTRDSENGQRFLERLQSNKKGDEFRIHEFQRYLLGALRCTSMVGTYSTWHDKSMYKYGYDDERTQEIAAKFCRILDSAKTGYRLKPEAFRQDQQEFGHDRGPAWKDNIKGKKKKRKDTSNLLPTQRLVKKRFIMDILVEAGQRELDLIKRELQEIFPQDIVKEDEDLARPWRELNASERLNEGPASFVAQKKADMALIRARVEEIYAQDKHELRKFGQTKSFTDYHITTRQDVLRGRSKDFDASVKRDEVITINDEATLRRIRASYAYIHDREMSRGKSSRFPFNVALRELCLIKSQANGTWLPILNMFCDKMRVDNPLRKRA